MRHFYTQRFPGVPIEAHIDGAYALVPAARAQWLELEDFPPYEPAVDEGEALFAAEFAPGAHYGACFGDGAVKQNYPYFDEQGGEVVTLEVAVNHCREAAGAAPLAYDSSEMIDLVAYMAWRSRGKAIAIEDPASAGALAAYETGKRFYSSRRGQLNFACVSCHVQIAGNKLRAETLSASIGHVTHWPVYRLKWQELGPLHRRFQECNSQVGAVPLALQSESYRDLEYFLTVMAKGLPLNGPAIRR